MSLNLANYDPALRYTSRNSQTISGTSLTVTDGGVTTSSIILITPTQLPVGHWKVVVASGSFTVTSTDAENTTFNYLVL